MMKNCRMLKVLLLTVVLMISGNVVKANPITVNDAVKRAKEFFSSSKARRVKGNLNLSLAYTSLSIEYSNQHNLQ